MNKHRIFLFLIFSVICSCLLQAQDQKNILTASEYLEKVSAKFSGIIDFTGEIKITQDETISKGLIYYKSPNLLRIDFQEPPEQVIAINGQKLQIYIPEYQVILEQELPQKSSRTLAALATSQGLNFLRDNYQVSYLIGPNPVPLVQDSEERVVKLKFVWRDIKEGFKEIIVAFNEDGVIRRMEGTQAITNKIVRFDYTEVQLNQGIPDERFDYKPPPYANVYDNYLYKESS